MSTIIRPTTIDDAPQIAEIIKLAFDEDASISQIQMCIEKRHTSFVAESNRNVVGFVDGFSTISINEERRHELDLLAVHPDCQGQGIGKKLIEHYTRLNISADFIRSLIAVGNIRMEKALRHFGYSPRSDVSALYVSTSVGEATETPSNGHFVPVSTYTYNGIWLEGQVTQRAIDTALGGKQHIQDVVGTVVSINDIDAIGLLQANKFSLIKLYRYWIKPF